MSTLIESVLLALWQSSIRRLRGRASLMPNIATAGSKQKTWFSNGEPTISPLVTMYSQVEHFLTIATPDDQDLVALDFESSTDSPDMTINQARQFVSLIRNELGRFPVLYGSRLIREGVGSSPDPVLGNCPLWYARYRSAPIGIPTQVWPTYTLWQFTDGSNGNQPHRVDGIGRCDRNRYQGTTEELRAAWPFTRPVRP
jgi:lysozyme